MDRNSSAVMYRGRESNPYERFGSQDFKSGKMCIYMAPFVLICSHNQQLTKQVKS